ncbi:MAG: Ig-like domain-containing protein [Eubacteriales bacterium]|nr:Ig-like domain-containing protein [Eubacteriales bacterium]
MTKLLCALLCGVLVCGAVAAATPKDNTDVAPAPRQVQAAIMNGKDPTTTETMKKGETIQLVVKQDDDSSEKQTAGSGSGNPSESESDWEIQEQQGQNVIELAPKTGIVKAKEAGEATVVKRVTGGVAACKIIVDDKTAVEKLVIKGSQDMRVGETQKLQLSIEPEQAQNDAEVTWKSDQPEILSVDETGKVTAHQSGSATITATADSAQDKLTISVNPNLTALKIVPDSMKMFVGDSIAAQIETTPADANLDALQWKSDNAEIAYYKDGRIYGIGVGTTRITASVGDVTASCTVRVAINGSISLDKTSMTLQVGKTGQLQANTTGALEGQKITWRSSNSAVASVDAAGKVRANKEGSAEITAEALGVKAACQVTVTGSKKRPDNNKPTNNKPNNNITGTKKPITGTGSTFLYMPRQNTGSTFLYMPGSTVTISEFAYTMPKNVPDAVYLTIDSKLDDVTSSIADTLSANAMQATFFVSIDNLYGADDTLRHLTGDGNSVGLLLTPEQANSGNAVALLDQANEQLSVITGMPTRLVRISGGSSGKLNRDALHALLNAGYRVWDWNTSANESSQAADASYRAVSKAIDTTGTVAVRFDGSVATDTVFRQLLPYMKYCGIQAKAIQASDNAVCNTAAG